MGDGAKVVLDFFAHKDKLLREKLVLKTEAGRCVTLELQARVLGKRCCILGPGHGTGWGLNQCYL